MSPPEDTLERLARLAREEEEQREHLPEELAAPLSEQKQLSIADAIHARLVAEQQAESATPEKGSGELARLSQRRFVAFGGVVLALAAGVLLWVGRLRDIGTPLPLYEVRLQGGLQSDRGLGPTKAPLRLQPGSKLQFELRPQSDVAEPVGARLSILPNSGQSVEVSEERSPAGALKVEARVPASLPERGELVLVVGRQNTLEKGAAAPRDPAARDPQQFVWSFERAP